jgi:hypothetical protein
MRRHCVHHRPRTRKSLNCIEDGRIFGSTQCHNPQATNRRPSYGFNVRVLSNQRLEHIALREVCRDFVGQGLKPDNPAIAQDQGSSTIPDRKDAYSTNGQRCMQGSDEELTAVGRSSSR